MNKGGIRLFLIFLLVISSAVQAVKAIKAVPDRDQVLRELDGRHWVLRDKAFLHLGEGVDKLLRKIVDNVSLINSIRFRALEVLALYENEATAKYLEHQTESQDPSFAQRGFRALSKGFSESHPERVRKAAQRLLENQDAHVRISAARVMRQLDTVVFQKFLKRESKSWVREAARK